MSQTLSIVDVDLPLQSIDPGLTGEEDVEFSSVVEDVRELGVQVKHDGMSLRQAHSIVRQAREAGYQARTQGLPNGSYQVVVDDRMVIENKQQWKLYQIVLPSKLGDVTKEDELAETAGVSLGTVLEFKQKNRRSLDYYTKRLKPIAVESKDRYDRDGSEEEKDLTELTQTDIADMTKGMQSVYEPRAQMSTVEKRAYDEYLNPTGETPYSFGGDSWKFKQPIREKQGGYRVA
jgi:hypothetical protein